MSAATIRDADATRRPTVREIGVVVPNIHSLWIVSGSDTANTMVKWR